MKRNISIALVILVAVVAWVLARPQTDDLMTPKPATAFEQAVAAGKPTFIMFTSDT